MNRLLLVSHNLCLTNIIVNAFKNRNTEIVQVSTMEDAIYQIVNDGFDLTLIDADIRAEDLNKSLLCELIDLSVVAGKITVLMTTNKTNDNIHNNISNMVYTINREQVGFNNLITNYLYYQHPDKQVIFDSIHKEIQSIKNNSFFNKHKYFCLI